MSTQGTAREVLARAVVKLGGVGMLARQLGISERILQVYLEGHQAVPDNLFLQALDLIEDDPSVASTPGRKPEPPPSS